MARRSGDQPTFADLRRQHSDAQDRAHKTGERAAQQFVKLLGTVHGGLGIAIAAWLQRIFEHPSDYPLLPLAGFLAAALFLVALGLAMLVLTPMLDQRSSNHAALSTTLNAERAWHHQGGAKIESMPRDDERSAAELAFVTEDGELVTKIEAADARAAYINTWSERLELYSVMALCAAFVLIGVGIFKTLP